MHHLVVASIGDRMIYWKKTEYDESTARSLLIDTHPFGNLRVNVNAQMLDEVYEAFDIVEGDGMYLTPEERIVIWGPNAA